ncbi:MAG: cytoplasmic protein [Pseudomonadota bacterium]
MDGDGQEQKIDFTFDRTNLHREASITDLKVGSIRMLVPVTPDGTEDKSRTALYIGHTQLMSPEGPIPIQASLPANSLVEAMDAFPAAMQTALSAMIEKLQHMQQERQTQKKDKSRIIVPGR